MLIENEKVKKIQLMGGVLQPWAGRNQGLKTMEIFLFTLPPGLEIEPDQHYGEVVWITLRGAGRATLEKRYEMDLVPNTTLVIPAEVHQQLANTGEKDLEILVIRGMVRPPEDML